MLLLLLGLLTGSLHASSTTFEMCKQYRKTKEKAFLQLTALVHEISTGSDDNGVKKLHEYAQTASMFKRPYAHNVGGSIPIKCFDVHDYTTGQHHRSTPEKTSLLILALKHHKCKTAAAIITYWQEKHNILCLNLATPQICDEQEYESMDYVLELPEKLRTERNHLMELLTHKSYHYYLEKQYEFFNHIDRNKQLYQQCPLKAPEHRKKIEQLFTLREYITTVREKIPLNPTVFNYIREVEESYIHRQLQKNMDQTFLFPIELRGLIIEYVDVDQADALKRWFSERVRDQNYMGNH